MQVVKRACFELVEFFQSLGLIRKQIQASLRVPVHQDPATANVVVDPMSGHPQSGSDLGNGQTARNVAWMGLAAFLEDTVLQADGLNGTG
jgi:hypothetical protein